MQQGMNLAIYHNLPSGGGKRALYEMTKRLAARHRVGVYTLSTAEHDFGDLRPFVERHVIIPFQPLPLARRPFGRLNQGIRTLDLLRLLAVQRRIAAEIDAGGYDVAFIHNCQYGQSPTVLRYLQTPAVYYCAEPPRQLYEPPVPRPYATLSALQRAGNLVDPLPALYRRVLSCLDRANVRSADLVLVNSAYSRESLYRAYGIFARVGYLGVDLDLFRPLPLGKESFVLSVGALNPRKGFDFLLQSLALVPISQRPPLIIVSNFADPRERAYLQSLARELNVALDIRLMIPDEELVRLYNQAQLVLYAPVMEPFGFVPIEAIACGTPVIGVREGGIRETVMHEETGLLTEREPRQFAEAIAALLDNEQLRARYGRQGRQHVQRQWTWERSVCALEALLSEAMRP